MKRSLCLLVSIVLLTTAAPAQEDAVKKDLAALQGQWKIAALEINGQQIPADNVKSASLVIKDNQYAVVIGSDKYTVTITLDPSKNPREIDMQFNDGGNKDKVARGIYKIEKDTFTLCRHLEPEKRRPTEFATWPDTNIFVLTWKKQ